MGILVTGRVCIAVLAALAAFAVLSSPAGAAKLLGPDYGAIFEGGDATKFYWYNDYVPEPVASRVVFTQNPDPNAPVWFMPTDNRTQIESSKQKYGSLDVEFDSRFKAGDWYWRVCDYVDTKASTTCDYMDEIMGKITVTSTAYPYVTKASAKKRIKRRIRRLYPSAKRIKVTDCRIQEGHVIVCGADWLTKNVNYFSVASSVKRDIKTGKTVVSIKDVFKLLRLKKR